MVHNVGLAHEIGQALRPFSGGQVQDVGLDQTVARRVPSLLYGRLLETPIVVVLEGVDPHDMVAGCERPVGKTRADEAGSAGH